MRKTCAGCRNKSQSKNRLLLHVERLDSSPLTRVQQQAVFCLGVNRMSSALAIDFDNGATWYAGSFMLPWQPTRAQVIIPVEQIPASMSNEEIGKAVRAMVDHAWFCYAEEGATMLDEDSVDDETLRNFEFLFRAYADRSPAIATALQSVLEAQEERRIKAQKQIAKEQRESKPRPGYIYLVQSPTGHFKIGRAKDPQNRTRTFNVKLPFEIDIIHLIPTDHMLHAEKFLHKKFSDKRANGEWFALSQDDVAYIKSLERLDV